MYQEEKGKMQREENSIIEQLCHRLAALGIAKWTFQIYWFSDEDNVESVSALDEQGNEVEHSQMEEILHEMWISDTDKQEYGLFELFVAEQRLVRVGRARPAKYHPYEYYQKKEENWYSVGRDDEEIKRVYALLQAEGIVRVDLQMYWSWGKNHVDALHCFLENGQERALPEHIAKHYLWAIVKEERKPYGHFRLLVNEQQCIRLGSIRPADIGMHEDDPFRGGEDHP